MTTERHQNGVESEFIVMKHFLEHGFGVSQPVREKSPYDMIADTGESLYRVQVKTAYLEERESYETLRVDLRRTHISTDGRVRRESYSSDEVDWFAVVYDGDVYLLKQEQVTSDRLSINPQPKEEVRPSNRSSVTFASDIELEERIDEL